MLVQITGVRRVYEELAGAPATSTLQLHIMMVQSAWSSLLVHGRRQDGVGAGERGGGREEGGREGVRLCGLVGRG